MSIIGDKTMNMKDLEGHMVPLKDFVVDLKQLVDNIHIGPQGDLLRSLESYNNTYGTNLQLNRQFNFKPGAYNDIKKAYGRNVLRWDMKPRGLHSIFDRIGRFQWRYRHFKQQTLELEMQIRNIKTLGIGWQDNTEDLEEEYGKLLERIDKEIATINKLYPDVTIEPYVAGMTRTTNSRGYNGNGSSGYLNVVDVDSPTSVNFMLIFKTIFTNETMFVQQICFDDEGSTKVKEDLIPTNNVLMVYTGVHLFTLLANLWKRDGDVIANRNGLSFAIGCLFFDNMLLNRHPYIGETHDKYKMELDGIDDFHFQHICRGNMSGELSSTLLNMQLSAHITHIKTWLYTYYIPQTNPLANFRMLKSMGNNEHVSNIQPSNNDDYYTYGNLNSVGDCKFLQYLHNALAGYSQTSSRSRNSYPRTVQEERQVQYINHVKIEDFPCVECTFQDDCYAYDVMKQIYGDDEMLPETEAILGNNLEFSTLFETIGDIRQAAEGVEVNRYPEVYIEDMKQFQFYRTVDKTYNLYLWQRLADLAFASEYEKYGDNDDFDVLETTQFIIHTMGRYHNAMNLELVHKRIFENIKKYNITRKFILDTLDGVSLNGAKNRQEARIEERGEEVSDNPPSSVDDVFPTRTTADVLRGFTLDEGFQDTVGSGDNLPRNEVEDDDDLTHEQRVLRWATQMGGGTQNL